MTNLFSRFSKIANLILLQTTIVVAIGFNSQVQAQLISESGNLRVEFLRSDRDACATGKPHASYSVGGSVTGLLYIDDCSQSEFFIYNFVDTSGVERCTGEAALIFASGRGEQYEATTRWEVRGAVSGYSCSTIGERYEYRMY